MTRWISSALCTMTLVAILFCLPVWDIRSASAEAAVSTMASPAMSEVHIAKRVPKKTPPAVQKPRPSVPTIPTPSAEPVPEPEPAEEPPEPDETPAEEIPDDASASDTGESTSNDTGATLGTEDSFSRTQDAQAVATYKSYALGRIASKKTYPYKARTNGFEGRIRVRIVINPNGTLAQIDILEPSEHEILNNACLAAIKKAAPFKKMTSGMAAMTLSFVMDFSLK